MRTLTGSLSLAGGVRIGRLREGGRALGEGEIGQGVTGVVTPSIGLQTARNLMPSDWLLVVFS